MYGVPVILYVLEEGEGRKGDHETHDGDHESKIGDDGQRKVVTE